MNSDTRLIRYRHFHRILAAYINVQAGPDIVKDGVVRVCIVVYVSVASRQAAWGKERPDGYYANEASCLLHWQTPHNSLLVLLEVRKYFIPVFPRRHILSPLLYFLREGISTYRHFIHTLPFCILPLFPRVCPTIHLHCYSNECTNRESFLKHLLTSTV